MFKKLYEDMAQLRKALAELFPNGFVRYETYKDGCSITITNFTDNDYVFGDGDFQVEWLITDPSQEVLNKLFNFGQLTMKCEG